ncbi:MAG: PLP-dependent cysteine synthase family protein [Thaumarchaeota archaeon]|nr:PLP-dependent cysteine synthase family protein [Nitrososphaerota archaeon]
MATKTLSIKLLERIGDTPLIELNSYSNKVKILAKLEWYNPFGSVKDRPAYWMIKDAEKKGILKKGKSIIIEPTSGNTGIALAGIARLMGYDIELVIPEKVSTETKAILTNLNAKLHETSDDLCPKVGVGTDQSISLATAISKARPETYYMPNQYENEINFLSHYEGTGSEIWEQTNGEVTHFMAGAGTGGTITGVGAFLKEKNSNVKIIPVQPQKNHLIQGLRNYEESAMPPLFKKRENIIDDFYTITNEESFKTSKELFEKEKLLVGPSSGCVMAAAKKVAENINEGTIVVIFADDGRKFRSLYVNQNVFTDDEFEKALNEVSMIEELPFNINR